MKVLVANLGSTSFKFRLFEMRSEVELARGGTERIGSEQSRSTVTVGEWSEEDKSPMPDHAAALHWALAKLTAQPHGCLQSAGEVAAIGFKAVHGGRLTGVQLVASFKVLPIGVSTVAACIPKPCAQHPSNFRHYTAFHTVAVLSLARHGPIQHHVTACITGQSLT